MSPIGGSWTWPEFIVFCSTVEGITLTFCLFMRREFCRLVLFFSIEFGCQNIDEALRNERKVRICCGQNSDDRTTSSCPRVFVFTARHLSS